MILYGPKYHLANMACSMDSPWMIFPANSTSAQDFPARDAWLPVDIWLVPNDWAKGCLTDHISNWCLTNHWLLLNSYQLCSNTFSQWDSLILYHLIENKDPHIQWSHSFLFQQSMNFHSNPSIFHFQKGLRMLSVVFLKGHGQFKQAYRGYILLEMVIFWKIYPQLIHL